MSSLPYSESGLKGGIHENSVLIVVESPTARRDFGELIDRYFLEEYMKLQSWDAGVVSMRPFYWGELGDKAVCVIRVKNKQRLRAWLESAELWGIRVELEPDLSKYSSASWVWPPDKPLVAWEPERLIRVLEYFMKTFKESEDGLARIKSMPLRERVDYLVRNPEVLLKAVEGADRREVVKRLYELLERVFDFVRVHPLEFHEEPQVFLREGNTLYQVETVIDPIAGVLVKHGFRKSIKGELLQAAFSAPHSITWRDVNPYNYLNLKNGVLNLETLELEPSSPYYFTYRLGVSISPEELRELKTGEYRVEENPVYKLWRSHFDSENWEYFIDAVGTWLAPYRFRLVVFLIGPPGVGKSTLLAALTRPIKEIVGHASLSSITGYIFGLEQLIGKQVNVYSERGIAVLKNVDAVNRLVGESDIIEVHRKGKPAVYMYALKSMVFAMNDPPLITEYGGETFSAFLDRLSIIQMSAPEDFKPRKDVLEQVSARDAFKFLLWCRVQLEERNWSVRKLDKEKLIEILMKGSNTALKFAEECIERVDYGFEFGKELYEAYVKWCTSRGITPMSMSNFYSTLSTQYQAGEREKRKAFLRVRLREECR